MIDVATRRVVETPRFASYGRIIRVVGLVIEAVGLESLEIGGRPVEAAYAA